MNASVGPTHAHTEFQCKATWNHDLQWSEVAEESLCSQLANPQATGALWEATTDQFMLCMPNIARCFVSRQSPIQVARADSGSRADLRWLVQGLPLAAYWVQRSYLALHGAAVNTERGAVVFLGHSGTGKSTLAAGLSQRELATLADEVVPIDMFNNSAIVQSSMSDVLLTESAVAGLAIDRSRLTTARAGLRRFHVAGLAQSRVAAPLRAIYILGTHNRQAIEFKTLRGQEKIVTMLEHAFNGQLPESTDIQQRRFLQLGSVLADVAVTKLLRPGRTWSGTELLDLLAKELVL